MNGFFEKIDHFFEKIGKNCTPFDTFLALFGTFDRVSDWYSGQPRYGPHYAIAMRRRAFGRRCTGGKEKLAEGGLS